MIDDTPLHKDVFFGTLRFRISVVGLLFANFSINQGNTPVGAAAIGCWLRSRAIAGAS